MDGSAFTLAHSDTGTINPVTGFDLVWANDLGGTSFGAYTLAYMMIGNPPSAGNIQKLEGWAAWRFNLVSLLPGGHPYKSAAPPC
jgi:hypothetical protein